MRQRGECAVSLSKEDILDERLLPGMKPLLGAGGDWAMLVFETIVLAILGVLAGAELVNLFMLRRLMGSVGPVLAPAVKRWTVKRDHVAAQAAVGGSHGRSATARPS